MCGTVLACGTDVSGLPGLDEATVVPVARRPGKSDVDPVLANLDGANGTGADLIVAGDDADLAAVALRLLRRSLLADVTVGFLPARGSAVAALWRLPTDRDLAWQTATEGAVAPVPLIRDDAGGVLVGRGTLMHVNGIAYCDDDVALRGRAHRIDVSPDQPTELGLVVTMRPRRWSRAVQTFHSRAFQLGTDPTIPVLDGVSRDRPTERWTWYRHTEDLRLVRPG